MAFVVIPATDIDAKSPVDDTLMGNIKTDLDDLDSRVITAGAKPFQLELQGKLKYLSGQYRSICYGIVNEAFQPSRCRFMLKKSGTSGSLGFDLRTHTSPKTPITGIDYQYSASTSSIAQQGSALNTQSIARATTQISTQSITHAKAAANVQSIILLGYVDGLGSSLVQYNLDVAIDSDTLVGDSIVMASCSNAQNDGTHVIIAKNHNGGNNVVVSNVGGVAQTSAAGTAQIKIMSYNFTNPVNSLFGAGYSHVFASHSTAANNGTLLVYAINQSGNNIWVKNPTGATQGGVAGTADTNFFTFALSSAASSTDYIVGESAKTASHTSALNDSGALPIIAVNSGGNNLVLYNSVGVTQGGVAGTINTNRWKYNLPSDPSSQVTAGDTMYFSSHSSAANNGTFTIKEVTSSTVVVYNTAGVAQGGAAGLSATTRKLVKFASDQSSVYSTSSYIEMQNCVNTLYNYKSTLAPFRVLQVNRGGGANYNVVIDNPTAPSQASPAGYVQVEMKSIFNTAPTLASDVTSLEANQNIVGTSTDFITATIAAQTPVMLYLTSIPSGDPRDLTVTLL
jgi:hypothetical protein